MNKLNFQNFGIFLFLKYICFTIFLGVLRNDFTPFLTGGGLIWTLILTIILTLISYGIFVFPLIHLFKAPRKLNVYSISLILILGLEYVLYTYLASQLDYYNGLYNAFLSIIFGFIFYKKAILYYFSKNKILP